MQEVQMENQRKFHHKPWERQVTNGVHPEYFVASIQECMRQNIQCGLYSIDGGEINCIKWIIIVIYIFNENKDCKNVSKFILMSVLYCTYGLVSSSHIIVLLPFNPVESVLCLSHELFIDLG